MSKFMQAVATAALLFTASSAQAATFCVAFTNYCDGLQLDVNGAQITGIWSNHDCLGTDAPVTGRITANGGQVFCTAAVCPSGQDWAFLINPPSNPTLDLLTGSRAAPQLVQDDLGYTLTPGVCPFRRAPGGVSTADPVTSTRSSVSP